MSSAYPEPRDRFRGCLLGGAVGDALGAPIEFMSRKEIVSRFGSGGIRDYAPAYGRLGAITDDTQMTLFTVDGVLRAEVRLAGRGICSSLDNMRYAYDRWYATQGGRPPGGYAVEPDSQGWLYKLRALHSRRAPGNTCLSALRERMSDDGVARNDSKGCGGVMRVAPTGLVAGPDHSFAEDPYRYGAEAAAITHGHPLGWQTAGIMALLVSEALREGRLERAVDQALSRVPREAEEAAEWVRRAARLAVSDTPTTEAIDSLGAGWVAEEALAIGVYAALRGETFEEAIVIAANHSGDSDSTGSIAGQLRGAAEGVGAIPARWLDCLELRDEITRLADDLYDLTSGEATPRGDGWWERYPA